MNRVILAATLAFVLCAPACARVFETWGRAGGDPLREGQPGWKRAYAADMEVNGGAGHMEVYSCAGSPAEVVGLIRDGYERAGAKVFLLDAGGLAWGFAFQQDRVARLILWAREGGRSCLVFRLEQAAADLERGMADSPQRMHEVPVIPGAVSTLYVQRSPGGTTLEVLRAPAPPDRVSRDFSSALRSGGWTSAPAAGGGDAALNEKDGKLLCVAVRAGDGGRGAVIALFRKNR